jgi:hypothetical protein
MHDANGAFIVFILLSWRCADAAAWEERALAGKGALDPKAAVAPEAAK